MNTKTKPATLQIPSWWFRHYPGIPPETFFKNAEAIRNYIATEHLQPLVVTTLPAATAAPVAKTATAKALASSIMDLGIRGGYTVPHLHFEGNIYLLTQKQWAALSEKVLDTSKSALSKAKTISFENAVTLQSAMQIITETPARTA
jgi:hypothetical protein